MAGNNNFFNLLRFFGKLIDDRITFQNLKVNPDARKVTTTFGWTAILNSVVFAILASLGAILLSAGISSMGDIGFILGVFAIILGVAFLVASLEFLVFALSHTIKQLVLNRRAISWIALAIFIICLGVAAFFVLSLAANIK